MTTTVFPCGDRILIRPGDPESDRQIIIPEVAKEKPQQGMVVEVGDGRLLDNGTRLRPVVRKNDWVLFGKYAGTEIEIDGEKLVVVREDDIICKIEKHE